MKIKKEDLEVLRTLPITVALDLLNIYWKKVKDGEDSYININYNGKDWRISTLGEIWNDRDNKKKQDEPPRVGSINLIRHLTGRDFHHTARLLIGAINGR